MKEFTAIGRLTLDGVVFYLLAEDEIEARALAKQGQFEVYNIDHAEPVNWLIAEKSVEENV